MRRHLRISNRRNFSKRVPLYHNPGKGRPIEKLIYATPVERRALKQWGGAPPEIAAQGVESFAANPGERSASNPGGSTGMGTPSKSSNVSSKSSPSKSASSGGGGNIGSGASKSAGASAAASRNSSVSSAAKSSNVSSATRSNNNNSNPGAKSASNPKGSTGLSTPSRSSSVSNAARSVGGGSHRTAAAASKSLAAFNKSATSPATAAARAARTGNTGDKVGSTPAARTQTPTQAALRAALGLDAPARGIPGQVGRTSPSPANPFGDPSLFSLSAKVQNRYKTDGELDPFKGMDKTAMGLLAELSQRLQDRGITSPIAINSLAQLPEIKAKDIGRVKDRNLTSQHRPEVSGSAIDFSVPGMSIADTARAAKAVGFKGIGTYPSFVHADLGPTRSWPGATAGMLKGVQVADAQPDRIGATAGGVQTAGGVDEGTSSPAPTSNYQRDVAEARANNPTSIGPMARAPQARPAVVGALARQTPGNFSDMPSFDTAAGSQDPTSGARALRDALGIGGRVASASLADPFDTAQAQDARIGAVSRGYGLKGLADANPQAPAEIRERTAAAPQTVNRTAKANPDTYKSVDQKGAESVESFWERKNRELSAASGVTTPKSETDYMGAPQAEIDAARAMSIGAVGNPSPRHGQPPQQQPQQVADQGGVVSSGRGSAAHISGLAHAIRSAQTAPPATAVQTAERGPVLGIARAKARAPSSAVMAAEPGVTPPNSAWVTPPTPGRTQAAAAGFTPQMADLMARIERAQNTRPDQGSAAAADLSATLSQALGIVDPERSVISTKESQPGQDETEDSNDDFFEGIEENVNKPREPMPVGSRNYNYSPEEIQAIMDGVYSHNRTVQKTAPAHEVDVPGQTDRDGVPQRNEIVDSRPFTEEQERRSAQVANTRYPGGENPTLARRMNIGRRGLPPGTPASGGNDRPGGNQEKLKRLMLALALEELMSGEGIAA